MCLSENYLHSTISSNDSNLIIPGYDLYREDHPSNVKGGGICIYYKNFLPLKVTSIQYLQEWTKFEIKIGDKLCIFVALYSSSSQSQNEFETFAKNFEINNPFLPQYERKFNVIKRQTMKISEKHEVGFRRKDILQVVVLRRKCIYSKKH